MAMNPHDDLQDSVLVGEDGFAAIFLWKSKGTRKTKGHTQKV
jgi:hypothetical protein